MNSEREEEAENDIMYDSIQVLDVDWEVDPLPEPRLDKQRQTPAKLHRQRSKSSGIATTASDVSEKTTSSLGKRSRETTDSINDEAQNMRRRRGVRREFTEEEETDEEEYAEDVEEEEEDGDDADADSIIAPASKKARFSEEDGEIMALLEEDAAPKKKWAASKPRKPRVPKSRPWIPPNPFRPKTWLSQGLYVGQDPDFDPRLTETKNRLKKASMGLVPAKQRTMLPMPMFSGARMLEKGRDFRLPFDVYGPLPPGQPKPEEWKKISKSASYNSCTYALHQMLTVLQTSSSAMRPKNGKSSNTTKLRSASVSLVLDAPTIASTACSFTNATTRTAISARTSALIAPLQSYANAPKTVMALISAWNL